MKALQELLISCFVMGEALERVNIRMRALYALAGRLKTEMRYARRGMSWHGPDTNLAQCSTTFNPSIISNAARVPRLCALSNIG